MRALLPTIALLAAAAAASPAALAATDDDLKRQIVGEWGDTAECKNGTLAFTAEGTFTLKGTGPDEVLMGTFTVVDGKLNGETPVFVMPEAAVSFTGETMILDEGNGSKASLVHCTPGEPPATSPG
jgi:hypothetical protein